MLHLKRGRFVFDGSMVRSDPIENLKSLWNGEASAVSTYSHCLGSFKKPELLQKAKFCLDQHSGNEQKLRHYIESLGGEVGHVDAWHAICSITDVLAGLLGEHMAAMMLRKMEEDFLEEYMDKLCSLENENLDFVQHQLIAQQESCYET